MNNYNYNKTASNYEKSAIIQKDASKLLFDLLNLQKNEDVLDLGCGTGNITSEIRTFTNGRITAIEPAIEMLNTARLNYSNKKIEYIHTSAENMNLSNEFDVIFSNSVFHWLKNPELVLNNCINALRSNGKIGLQCPATPSYSNLFLNILEEIKGDFDLNYYFQHYKSPWFLLANEEEYRLFFEKAGFHVIQSSILTIEKNLSVEKVFRVFRDAASPAYLNQENYSINITENYKEDFLTTAKRIIDKKSYNGHLKLDSKRLYLIAKKKN